MTDKKTPWFEILITKTNKLFGDGGTETVDTAYDIDEAIIKLAEHQELDPTAHIDKWADVSEKAELDEVEKLKLELFFLKKAGRALIGALEDNYTPIEGTQGVADEGETPTGSYIRQQFIVGEMEDLQSLID
jgi:hypothetical protein